MDAEMQYWQAVDEARIERERAKDARIAELQAERDEWRDDYERQRDAGDEARARIAELEEALRAAADALQLVYERDGLLDDEKPGLVRARTALKEADQ